LKRAVQKYVEDVVAEKVISGGLKEGDKIQLDYNPEEGMRVSIPKKVKKAKDTASE
jgi:ATP-dependent Clp protease ATP-binding subunit ClpA